MKRNLFLGIVLLLTATIAGAQQIPLQMLANDATVGSRDVLQIKVLEEPGVDAARIVVGDDGTITLNLLGKVEVAGLSAPAIEARLKNLLEAGYVTKATVSVQVVEYGNRPISVVGAVTRPGQIGATSNLTLMQAITQAGGLSTGYGPELYILRTADNGLTEKISIPVEDLMVNGNPDLNLPLAPADVINIPVEQPIQIYVMGEVTKPGKVDFRRSQTPTVLQALSAAGGPTDRASKTLIIRRQVNGKDTKIEVNWRKISSGAKPDVMLRDNDTLVVNESLF